MNGGLFPVLLLGFVAATVLAVALWAHALFWRRRIAIALPYAETHRIATADKSAIELRRITQPVAQVLPPVLLVHGIAINHRNMDTHPDYSLARALAKTGRDVWLLTLRSGRSDLSAAERKNANFAAIATHDVPLAVAEVLQRTGHKHLDYVGFSMGGILLYATLGRALPVESVRRAVILGSPGRVAPIIPGLKWLLSLPHWLIPNIPLRWPSALVIFCSEWFATPVHHISINPHNSAKGMVRQTLADAVQDIPGPLARDLATWAYGGGAIRLGDDHALQGLRHISIPVHFFAGGADNLGPPASLRVAYDAWGIDVAAPKHFTELSVANGHSANYGHADLTVGKQVHAEVYAPIIAFLAEEHVAEVAA